MANSTWVNNDGLLVRYGVNQGKRGARPGSTQSNSKEQELILEVELAGPARVIYSTDLTNDGTADGFANGLDSFLPVGAVITDQRVVVMTAAAGGTSYVAGTFARTGAAIDADGIRIADGSNGALVGTQIAAPSYVTVTTTGTYTAGKIKLIVRYVTA